MFISGCGHEGVMVGSLVNDSLLGSEVANNRRLPSVEVN